MNQGSPRTAGVVMLALVSALVGGAVVAIVLALAGDLNGSHNTTTVVERASATATPTANTSTGNGVNPASLYAQVSPGVVDITAQSTVTNNGSNGFFSPFGGGGTESQTDSGAGFEVDASGDILTAAHVVSGASQITVTLQSGQTRPARLLGIDTATDTAVIKVDPSGLTLHPLALGSDSQLVVGDFLAAIGDPFGYDRSLSTGVVAGLDRTIQAPNGFTIAHAIQTDAALNPGNSGGPVLDQSGQVIGIADQIATDGGTQGSGTEQNSGVGFAVPIDLVKAELSELEKGQHVAHAYLGVSTSDNPNGGVLIASVEPGGPAASAGIQQGDVLTAINGSALQGSDDLINDIATLKPGQKVTFTVKRGSKRLSIVLTLGTQPSQAPTSAG